MFLCNISFYKPYTMYILHLALTLLTLVCIALPTYIKINCILQLDLIQITSDLHISPHKPVCDSCSDYSCYQYFKYISSKKINSINSRIHSYHQRKNLLRYFLLKCDNLKEVFYDENECILKLGSSAMLDWFLFQTRICL